ncbi:hypothetical protein EDB87DRAFT_1648320 [Lactarius vividus]|nr:hypothetical protein EDB87DRAFT_1648320 [Lactarius vividus]
MEWIYVGSSLVVLIHLSAHTITTEASTGDTRDLSLLRARTLSEKYVSEETETGGGPFGTAVLLASSSLAWPRDWYPGIP